MNLLGPLSAAWSAEKTASQGTSYAREDQLADRRRRQQDSGGFAAVLAQAMRR